jgi:excisionase family DNA binding protein
LNKFVFAVADIEKFMGEVRADRPYLMRIEIALRLHVHYDAITTWASNGLLKPAKVHKDIMYFDREEVGNFINGHVFVEEAAGILGVGKLVVQKWARNGRLKAVSGNGVDGRHRYLFRREDVERLRPENRLTAPQLAKRLFVPTG